MGARYGPGGRFALFERVCSCGQTFTARCVPVPLKRRDGTETVRWLGAKLCDACMAAKGGDFDPSGTG